MPRERGTNGTELGRRAFLGGTTAVLGGVATGGVGAAGATPGEEFPRVTTRGHFDITWYGSVYLTDGNSRFDYGTAGSIPGTGDGAPDELLLHAHGWRNDADDAVESFEGVRTALRANGYEPSVIGYSWDSDTLYTRWWDATEIAEQNGLKLANFLAGYAEENPDTTLRVTSHSLGARVVLRAVEVLNANGLTDVVHSLTLLGGAADNDAVSTDGRYGADVAAATGATDNFYKTDDAVLEWAYGTAEVDSAVGEEGCEGDEPENYSDHRVDYVDSHGDYYRQDDGCMPAVVESF